MAPLLKVVGTIACAMLAVCAANFVFWLALGGLVGTLPGWTLPVAAVGAVLTGYGAGLGAVIWAINRFG